MRGNIVDKYFGFYAPESAKPWTKHSVLVLGATFYRGPQPGGWDGAGLLREANKYNVLGEGGIKRFNSLAARMGLL